MSDEDPETGNHSPNDRAQRTSIIQSLVEKPTFATAAFLLIAVFTTSLSLVVIQFLHEHRLIPEDFDPFWFLGLVCSFVVFSYFWSARKHETVLGTSVRRYLQTKVRPDAVPTDKLEFKVQQNADQFADSVEALDDQTLEVMLILKQLKKCSENRRFFSGDSIIKQLKSLQDVDSLESKVKWVAFIANDQEFVAAQDYRHFVTQIIIEKNIVA